MTPSTPRQPDLGTRIGAAIRSVSKDFGWSQRELARRLGTNQSAIRRLESGGLTMDMALATAALELLGIRVIVDPNPPGLAVRREQHDLVHARCCGYAARQLAKRGWDVRAEVEIGQDRYRGWIDLLAFRSVDRALLVIEVKTEVRDIGQILRTIGWYVRSSRVAASRFGWRPRVIAPALLALPTIETELRLAADAEILRTSLPGRAEALSAWIDDPSSVVPAATIALMDPATRRRAWLWRTRADGRRSPAPYRDYRDAAAALARGSPPAGSVSGSSRR